MLKFKSKLKKHITTIASIKASWLEDIYVGEDATWIKCPDQTTYDELSKLNDVFTCKCDGKHNLLLRDRRDTVEVVRNINGFLTEIRIIRTEYR